MTRELEEAVERARAHDAAWLPAWMTPECVEAVARVIDPDAFSHWQAMYDYCLKDGDSIEHATATASFFHDVDGARRLARAAIIAVAPFADRMYAASRRSSTPEKEGAADE